MTSTAPAAAPKAPALDSTCYRIVDEDKEVICGRPSVTEVLVRNPFSIFAVPLCAACSKDHREFYSARNQHRNRQRIK